MKRSLDSHTDIERVSMIFRDKYKDRSALVDSDNNYLGNSKNLNNIINFIVGSNSKTNPPNPSGQKAPKRDAPQKSGRKPSKPQKQSRNSLSSHYKKNLDAKVPLFQDKSLKTNPFNHYNRTPSPAQNLNFRGIRPKKLANEKFSAQKKTGNPIISRLDKIISGKEHQIKNKPVKDRSRVEDRIDSKMFVDRHYGFSR
jgi:hypothetical protein